MKRTKNKETPHTTIRKNNPVAKHSGKFNRSSVIQNKKKAAKQGHSRYKENYKSQVDDGSTE